MTSEVKKPLKNIKLSLPWNKYLRNLNGYSFASYHFACLNINMRARYL